MNFAIYNPEGMIVKRVDCPHSMIGIQLQDGELYLSGLCNDKSQYIPNISLPVITDKPINTTTIDKTTVVAGGVDAIALSTIPDNAVITITGDGVWVKQSIANSEIITFDLSGTYQLKIESFPYMDYEVTINVN